MRLIELTPEQRKRIYEFNERTFFAEKEAERPVPDVSSELEEESWTANEFEY